MDTCFIALQNDDEYIERPQVGGLGALFRSDDVNTQSTIVLHEYAYVKKYTKKICNSALDRYAKKVFQKLLDNSPCDVLVHCSHASDDAQLLQMSKQVAHRLGMLKNEYIHCAIGVPLVILQVQDAAAVSTTSNTKDNNLQSPCYEMATFEKSISIETKALGVLQQLVQLASKTQATTTSANASNSSVMSWIMWFVMLFFAFLMSRIVNFLFVKK